MSDSNITMTPASEPMKRRNTRKKDNAPRGVFRHRSGVWATRFTCGAGCIHQERVGPLKSNAVRVYHDRRARALGEPGWCPRQERREAGHAEDARRQEAERRAAKEMPLGQYEEVWWE